MTTYNIFTKGVFLVRKETIQIGGKEISIETGEIARQAHGSVIVRQGDTMVLVTVVADEEEREGLDFFPLSVEYRARSSAAGRFPGGFIKREQRPQEYEILASRIIDRSIRPLFPENFKCETQVMATVLSFEENAEPEILSIIGASAAIQLSNIPWNGPLGGLRIVSKNGKLIVLPTAEERKSTELDIIISCSKDGLVMLEGMGNESNEETLVQAISLAQKSLEPLMELLQRWPQEERIEKRAFQSVLPIPEEIKKAVEEAATEPLKISIVGNSKKERSEQVKAVFKKVKTELEEKFPEQEHYISLLLEELKYKLFREYMASQQKRVDGRKFDEIRQIWGKVSWLPRVHGSALFTRGETQALVSCTLGTVEDEQIVETLAGETRQKFMLHYNFPPFSVGEVKPLHGPGRRETGHGYLASRALRNILPDEEKFPYTIRLVSDISESNGSSSMASVCGGCLALMDAGVPIKRPAAGVAMGLVKEGDQLMVISDIMGEEDHLGDMDFKVAGTEVGITAVQMDNKIGSLPWEVLSKALEQARKARLHILGEMKKILPETRPSLAAFAPRVMSLQIRKERIRDLVGAGGKTIQELQETFKVKIDVESNTGKVKLFSFDQTSLEKALKRIHYLTGEPEVGKCYKGEVTSVKDFGAFVRLFCNIEGMVHISEMANKRVEKVTDVVREGDEVIVRVLGVDRQGKIRLSRKEALNVPESQIENL